MELSDARLANALIEVKPDLAALIACHTFEILIRRLAAAYGLPFAGPALSLEQVIDSLPNFGPVNAIRKAKWRTLKEARNRLMHSGAIPGVRGRALLIEEVVQLEADLLSVSAESRVPVGS